MSRVLIQMHGLPGTGKTTLARALGRELSAVVIDKDVISSALIRHGIRFAEAGAPAYQVMYAQSQRFLSDGLSVVFDSPCFWPRIEATTRSIAAAAGAAWVMIETDCPAELRDTRLATRKGLESNPTVLPDRQPGMYDPACERLVVDTSRPVEDLVVEAAAYVRAALRPSLPEPLSRPAGVGEVRVPSEARR